MLTLLGSIIGFIGSLVPDFMRLMKDSKDKAHELKILQHQIEWVKTTKKLDLEEIQAGADSAEALALYRHARKTGIGWIDALSGTVRPCITYAFFFLYAVVKVSQIIAVKNIGYDLGWAQAITNIWHPEDQALFAAVMSFWFGQRALSKFHPQAGR
tara:strand:+ start:10823 stop:11290 length:468 start_codon:yes stop_codon:yes gene_type:complete